MKRRYGLRKDNAAFVEMLLDRGCDDPAYSDTVTTHFRKDGSSVLVEIGYVHCSGILGTQLKNMPHLDPAADFEHPLAVRGRVPTLDVAYVGHQIRFGQV